MFIFGGQSDAHNLFPYIHLLPLSVYFLDKRGHHGALLHELITARVVLEVVVELVESVEAARDDYHEEGQQAGETLQTTVPTR